MVSSHDTSVAVPQDDFMNIDEQVRPELNEPLSQLSSARNQNPFSLLDPTIGRNIFDTLPDLTNQTQFVTNPRELREIPIEVKDGNQHTSEEGLAPIVEDVTGTVPAQGPDTRGTVIIDNDDAPSAHYSHQEEQANKILSDTSLDRSARPSVPEFERLPDYSNDIEEEMIHAAIEASRREAEEKYPDYKIGRQIVHLFLGWISCALL